MDIDPRRHLEIEGTHNVRDLGGYETRNGRQTRWGRFLRSDGLQEVTAAGRVKLLELGLKTVVDLRRGSELAIAPSVFAGSTDVAYHHLDMIGEGPLEEAQPLSDGAERIAHTYCLWLDRRPEAVGRILGTLAAPDALPALYNCAAGKDRTGVISALLLSVAGVEDDLIAADYTLSARFLLDRYLGFLEAEGNAQPEVSEEDYRHEFVPAAAMSQVMRHLHDEYGGAESYMRTVGLQGRQIERLRSGLLED